MIAPGCVWPGLVELLGQAEVGDLGRAVRGQQHVGRLQVAVDDALLVGRLHGPGQRLDQAGRLARAAAACRRACWSRLPPAQNSSEKKGKPVVLADLVDLHDVGVLQAGDRLGLGPEAGQLGSRRRGRRPGSSSGPRCGSARPAGPCRRRPCRRGPARPGSRSRAPGQPSPCCPGRRRRQGGIESTAGAGGSVSRPPVGGAGGSVSAGRGRRPGCFGVRGPQRGVGVRRWHRSHPSGHRGSRAAFGRRATSPVVQRLSKRITAIIPGRAEIATNSANKHRARPGCAPAG